MSAGRPAADGVLHAMEFWAWLQSDGDSVRRELADGFRRLRSAIRERGTAWLETEHFFLKSTPSAFVTAVPKADAASPGLFLTDGMEPDLDGCVQFLQSEHLRGDPMGDASWSAGEWIAWEVQRS